MWSSKDYAFAKNYPIELYVQKENYGTGREVLENA